MPNLTQLYCLLILFFLASTQDLHSQHNKESGENSHSRAQHHKLTIMMANSNIRNAIVDNDFLIVPTWGLHYDYWFKEKWALGFHTEIMLQQFEVETKENTGQNTLTRTNPVSLNGVVLYRVFPKWTVLAGYGVEIEKHENLYLYKIGLEYEIPLPKNWELGIGLEYDHKLKTYSSWMFGIGFSKILFKKMD